MGTWVFISYSFIYRYNGDVDTVCNFLGDEWFIEALVEKYNMTTTQLRRPWLFTPSAIGGYRKAFSYKNINIDLVTVKARSKSPF
jgi:hypothetical protein